MNTGYGHSLLAGDAERLLVSFVEFSKDPEQQLAVTTMSDSYLLPRDSKDLQHKPGRSAAQHERIDHGTAFGRLFTEHLITLDE